MKSVHKKQTLFQKNLILANTQIMTGLEGNREICLPREIQDSLPKSFYYRGAVNVNKNFWGGDHESQGANR